MLEPPQKQTELSPQNPEDDQAQEWSRRDFIRRVALAGGLAAAGTALAPGAIGLVAEGIGAIADHLASPERALPDGLAVIEPRQDNTPTVESLPRGTEPFAVITSCDRNRHGTAVLRFGFGTTVQFEHAHKAIEPDSIDEDIEFKSAGTAIITTAEGLDKQKGGDQRYVHMFRSKGRQDQIVGVAYPDGALYAFAAGLGDPKQTAGEWVRIVHTKIGDELPSHAHVSTSWDDIHAAAGHDMLIQDVAQGTNTLRDIGYHPFGAVLPTTQMPEMAPILPLITPESCVTDTDELCDVNSEKHYWITDHGDIIDTVHLRAKSAETLGLFMQLYAQHVIKTSHPSASVRYSAGNEAKFEFDIDPRSLQPDVLLDTVFSVMTTASAEMEGVSQRYALEKLAPGLDTKWPSGLSAEDLFTNSLGITGMIALIHHKGLMEKLTGPLQAIHQKNPKVSTADFLASVENVATEMQPQMVELVLSQTAQELGVRKMTTPADGKLPRGLYPLISTKVTEADGAHPTRIDLQAAGINPNNPKVHQKLKSVPAFTPTIQRALEGYSS